MKNKETPKKGTPLDSRQGKSAPESPKANNVEVKEEEQELEES